MSAKQSGAAGFIHNSLSPEQRQIVDAGPDDNLLVLAPPGTGKTHTVIARIKYLVEEAGLEPHELLVLCFTRAAVGEIMQRIRTLIKTAQVHDDLRFVSIRTFDSYATRLLLASDTPPELGNAGYDDRIRMAIDALSDYESDAADIVGNCRHLIVDEIQDVVGVRAELVRTILYVAGSGFTLLGDPAQGIYGFTLPEDEALPLNGDRTGNGTDFVSWVQDQAWPGGLQTIELNHNYRSSGQVDAIGRTARSAVLSPMPDDRAYKALRDLLAMTPAAGSGKAPGPAISQPGPDSVCILCRTNGELLQIASLLARHGIAHYIRPRSTDYALPAWIGRLLGAAPERVLTLPDFEQLWQQQIGDHPDASPQQAFHWLRRVEGQDHPALDIHELRLRLYRGHRLPDDADASLAVVGSNLSLSTIHAAKGREFDHVVILAPDQRPPTKNGTVTREEVRVLYVAATRARELLSRLERDGIHGQMWVERFAGGRRRWVARRGGYYYMEIGLPEDVDTDSHVSTWIHRQRGDALRLQNMLWKQVRPGTPLFIHREFRGGHPFFLIVPQRGTPLEQTDFAQLSRAFRYDLEQLLRKFSRSSRITYPEYLLGVRVTSVVTEVLPPYPENVHEPFARTGFCLGIRLRGLVSLGIKG